MRQLLPRGYLITGQWPALTFYQRFEGIAAFVLTLMVAVVILVALYRLIVEVVGALVFGALNPLNHEEFQTVFGEMKMDTQVYPNVRKEFS